MADAATAHACSVGGVQSLSAYESNNLTSGVVTRHVDDDRRAHKSNHTRAESTVRPARPHARISVHTRAPVTRTSWLAGRCSPLIVFNSTEVVDLHMCWTELVSHRTRN